MKKITVTEENFERILQKLQKICNNYRMCEFYNVFRPDGKEDKEFRNYPLIRQNRYEEITESDGGITYKRISRYGLHDKFVHVTKHNFREVYESGDTHDAYYNFYMHAENKPYIHLSMDSCSALVLEEGSIIRFIPFGFIVYDKDIHDGDEPITIYRHTFIKHFIRGKIHNLQKEIDIRDYEIEREAMLYNDLIDDLEEL